MKIIAIITGNRKARIINMRTANYDKYKIIFIDSCTVQVLFDQHDERESLLLPLLLSFDPSFVPFSTHLLFISLRFSNRQE